MKNLPIIFVSALLLLTIHLSSQSKNDQITEIVTEFVKPNSPGLAIIVTQGEKLVYKDALGLSDVMTSNELQAAQLFRIGSITKQFTAIAILKLASENKLLLKDPIKKHISNITKNGDLSILQLLNHTSGLGNQSDIASYANDELNVQNYPESMLSSILNSQLKFEPGSNYAYSNLGYILLGYIVDRVSDVSFEEYLKTNFFDPLRMKNTGFEYIKDYRFSMSKGHSLIDNIYQYASTTNMKIPYAAGGLVSDLNDLAIWNKAVMSGEVIPLSFIEHILKSASLPTGQSTGYSMGWQIGNIQGFKTIKHDGIVNGYTSMSIYVPETDVFVAVLSNCDCYRHIELPASEIVAIVSGKPFPSTTIEVSNTDLEKYQGIFKNQNNEMRIVLQDDELMYFKRGGEKHKLMPTSKNTFLISSSLDQIKFDVNQNETFYELSNLTQSQEQWNKISALEGFNSLTIDNAALDEYVGRYQVPDRFVFEVVRIGNQMYGQVGGDKKEIVCYTEDGFYAQNSDAVLSFHRDDSGQINQLKIVHGLEFSATRIN